MIFSLLLWSNCIPVKVIAAAGTVDILVNNAGANGLEAVCSAISNCMAAPHVYAVVVGTWVSS